MTELQLYKFLNEDNKVQEYRWEGNGFLVWIWFYDLKEFTDLVGSDYICEGGIDCNLQDTCVCLDLVPIAEYHEIELENILEKE